ncbi:MAG: Eco57I restriction-modification methylase domain-containing protein, partial [Clostridia bacterium]|nr:Eco57I restriction-modification methylase domain-containing protein [Clostridia bacterium]
DSLLIARINLLMTFCDYMQYKWNRKPKISELNKIVNIISWNIFQMNGINGNLPIYGLDNYEQMTIFSLTEEEPQKEEIPCYIYNWRVKEKIKFNDTKEGKKMKFDFVIGNPPYQDETVGEQKKFAPPVYNAFIDGAYSLSDKVELIHPARFLFNAGGTKKEWNEKMLNDEHLKILYYEQKSDKIFVNTDIKGGICISYHDKTKKFGAIGTYTAFPELNSILHKVKNTPDIVSLSEIISNRGLYRFSPQAYSDCPTELAKNTDSRIGASSFERMPSMFTEDKPNDNYEYIQIFGLLKSKRVYRWFRRDYFNQVSSFEKYKVLVPAANGSGALGEVLSTPVIGQPVIGHTETFISIGSFDTEKEAQNCLKYIKSKFARCMLGVLKITQHNSPEKWKYVPMQDFTANSDIDWTKSVAEIDRQLYKKYGLTQEEIDFIETKVKEMN